jgi:hypothetical protein
MGMEYDLLKPKKKERFDLGKGMWSKVFTYDYGKDFLLSNMYIWEEHLYYAIVREIAWQFDKETKLKYFSKIANDIYNWCGPDIIQFHNDDSINELYWDIRYKSYDSYKVEYPYTGGRYNVRENEKENKLCT